MRMGVVGLAALVAACISDKVISPVDLEVRLASSHAWSGGEVRIIASNLTVAAAPESLRIGSHLSALTRLDDSTFAGTLPDTSGNVDIGLTGSSIPVGTIAVHGYEEQHAGPAWHGQLHVWPAGAPSPGLIYTSHDSLLRYDLVRRTTELLLPAGSVWEGCGYTRPALDDASLVLAPTRDSVNARGDWCGRLRLWRVRGPASPAIADSGISADFCSVRVRTAPNIWLESNYRYSLSAWVKTLSWSRHDLVPGGAPQVFYTEEFVGSPDGNLVIASGGVGNGTTAWPIFDARTGAIVRGVSGHTFDFGYAATFADSATILAGVVTADSLKPMLVSFRADNGAARDSIRLDGPALAIAADPATGRAYVMEDTHPNNQLRVVDLQTFRTVAILRGPAGMDKSFYSTMVLSPIEHRLYVVRSSPRMGCAYAFMSPDPSVYTRILTYSLVP